MHSLSPCFLPCYPTGFSKISLPLASVDFLPKKAVPVKLCVGADLRVPWQGSQHIPPHVAHPIITDKYDERALFCLRRFILSQRHLTKIHPIASKMPQIPCAVVLWIGTIEEECKHIATSSSPPRHSLEWRAMQLGGHFSMCFHCWRNGTARGSSKQVAWSCLASWLRTGV